MNGVRRILGLAVLLALIAGAVLVAVIWMGEGARASLGGWAREATPMASVSREQGCIRDVQAGDSSAALDAVERSGVVL